MNAALDRDQVRSVCVLCWGLLGDVLVRVPTIEALKRRYPRARLTAVVDPSAREALANHPDCDEVFVFSRRKRPLGRYVGGLLANVWRLRRRRFDLCVNLYSGGSSPWITRLINARVRLGFDHTPALRRANNLLAPRPLLRDNWYRAFGTILGPLGVAPESIRRGTSFHCTAAARVWAAEALPAAAGPYAAFNLGAGAAEKRWPVASFVALARHAHERHRLVPVVFTNPGMETLAAEFVRDYGPRAPLIEIPPTSLDRVGAVMERCRCVVTGDTSLMHLAFGLKRPTLVLFTHTRPEVVAPEDCLHVPCFLEDPSRHDAYGQPLGTRAIPVALATRGLDELLARIERTETVAPVLP